jgi:hypothetical protein
VASREESRSTNQELFRAANELLEERGEKYRAGGAIPFLCECADVECLGQIELSRVEYEQVRASENRFVILPGHARVEGERVIEDKGRFHIAEKQAP